MDVNVCLSAALFGGFGLQVNTSVPKAVIRLPFPPSATWYLTLQLVCNRLVVRVCKFFHMKHRQNRNLGLCSNLKKKSLRMNSDSAPFALFLKCACLCLFCSSECGNTSVVSVLPELFVSACVEDCGPYGECRLLRSYSYLYSACVCKAGKTNDNRTPEILQLNITLDFRGFMPNSL